MVTLAFSRASKGRRSLLLCTIFLSVFWASLASAKDTAHADWMPEEYDALVEELDGRSSDVLALAPLLDLMRLTRWMRAEQAEDALRHASERVEHPLAHAWAQYTLLRFYLASGQHEKLHALEESMGFVDDWMLVGPFRNDGMDGFESVYDPELEGYQGEEQAFVGKFNDLRWMHVSRASETGYIAAHERIGEASTAVLYATTECYFERSADRVELSVDGAYKLWLNEAPVARQEEQLGGVMLRDTAPVNARRGWHRVFMKVASDRVDPGWHMRFVDAKGRPVVRECRPLQDDSSPVEQEEFPEPQTLAAQLKERAEDEDWTANDRADAAYVLKTFHRKDPSEPWQYFLDDVDTDALSSVHRVRAARAEHTHWRKRQRVEGVDLSSASLSDGLYRLTMQASEIGLQARKEGVNALRTLQERFPNDPRVRSEWLAYLAKETSGVSVWEQSMDLAEDYGARPALCHAVKQRLPRRDTRTEALHQACAERSLDSLAAVERYLTYLARGGHWQAVDATVKRLDPLWAGRVDWLNVQETVAALRGDIEAELDRIEQEIAQRPHDAYPYIKQANALIRIGRNDEAAVSLRTAIELQPQRQSARDLLSLIETQGDAFYAEWAIPDEELRALAQTLEKQETGTAIDRVANQTVANIYRSGLSSTYHQIASRVQRREGIDDVSQYGVGFVPGQSDVQVLSMRVLKPDGTQRETYDVQDLRPYAGATHMYNDVHERRLSVSNVQVDDIVVVEYVRHETAQQNMFDTYFGDISYIDSSVPTALFRYVLRTPKDLDVFIRRSGEDLELPRESKDGAIERVYEERDLARIPSERNAPGPSERYRYLDVSTYDDVDAMANWYWNLIKDQFTTSPEMIATVESLIEGVDDRAEQVARIYDYVVRNTRYVHVGLGIAGWRPYRTTSCFNQRAGDCKDTASLLKVMLGIAGIESHFVLIRTRDNGRLQNPLPSLHGYNHAIAYVPEFDILLDGTVGYHGWQDLPFGDQGATALIIEDGRGGRFIESEYRAPERNADSLVFDVDARQKPAKGNVRLTRTGDHGASLRRYFIDAERQRKALVRALAPFVPNIEVEDAEFKELDDWAQAFDVTAHIEGGQWLQKRGDEYVMHPFGYKAFDIAGVASASTRALPLLLEPPKHVERRLDLRVPEGLSPMSLPDEEQVVESENFGRFVMRVTWDAERQHLRVEGRLEHEAAWVSPEDYPDYRAWVREVERRANRPLLFERVETADEAKR